MFNFSKNITQQILDLQIETIETDTILIHPDDKNGLNIFKDAWRRRHQQSKNCNF